MDDRLPTLASAVIVPNIPQSSTPPQQSPEAPNGHSHTLKRRASGSPASRNGTQDEIDGEDAYAKRVRLTSDLSAINNKSASDPNHVLQSAPVAQPRKRVAADPEADRKRGRRLFGSLLGTLSQSGSAPSAAQQRRVEAERRQREKLAAQQSHAGASLAERPGSKQRTPEELEALKREWATKQEQWVKEARLARHANMRAQAGYLQTSTQPKLFWLPYDLTSAEEDKIKEQREQVEREIEEDLRTVERENHEADTQMPDPGERVLSGDSKDQNDGGERHRNAPDKEDAVMDGGQDQPSAEGPQDTDAIARAEADAEEPETKHNGEQDGKEDDDEDMVLNRDAEEDPLFLLSVHLSVLHNTAAAYLFSNASMAEAKAGEISIDAPATSTTTDHPRAEPPKDKRGWDGKLRVGKAAEQYEAEHMDGPTPPDSDEEDDEDQDDRSEDDAQEGISTAATSPVPTVLDTANGRQVRTQVEQGPEPATIDADEDLLAAYGVDETEIDLNHSRISSITHLALERFGQIERLCLRQNQIPSMHFPPASAWPSTSTLRELDLYDNAIAHVKGLDDFVNLEILDLSFNSIKHIKRVSHLSKLKDIYFVQNRISKIENLEGLTALTNLELGGNRIREIEGLEALTSLTHLWLGKNKIAELKNLEQQQQLELLSIQSNRLTASSLSHLAGLPCLTELYLSHNLVDSLVGLRGCVHLTTLDISFNPVAALDGLQDMRDLEEFWASGCRLDSFDDVRDQLADKEQLETIYLEGNPLQLRQPALYRNKVRLAVPQVRQIDATYVRA